MKKSVEFKDLAMDQMFIFNDCIYQKIGKNSGLNLAYGYRTTFKSDVVVLTA